MTQIEQLAIGLVLIGAHMTVLVAVVAVIERVPCVRRLADRVMRKIRGRWENE